MNVIATTGCVRVALFTRTLPAGRCEVKKVQTASSLGLRRGVTQMLVGLPLSSPGSDAVEGLLRTLYAVCPEAHVAAWRLASKGIVGREVSAVEYGTLNRRVALEAALGHLRLLTIDLPRVLGLGRRSAIEWLRRVRGECGGSAIPPSRLIEAIEALITGVALERFPRIRSNEALYAWSQTGASHCARMFQSFFELLAWEISETRGALSEVFTRVFARLNDLLEIAVAIKCGKTFRPRLQFDIKGNVAAVQVDTARGTLQWWVEAMGAQEEKDGQRGVTVRRAKICAPTDRNFAVGGIAERLLKGLKAPNETILRKRATGIVATLDPCTESVIQIHPVESAYA